ncbi:fibronectin type III domain-containing protein [Paenibacillus sp. GCM10027626]|uniref:fibronectin type III domain-containing protein n=1 Tax=Paenibacillus sp. GCM10027626 TaxID=3273411 RepID=UPI0036421AD8
MKRLTFVFLLLAAFIGTPNNANAATGENVLLGVPFSGFTEATDGDQTTYFEMKANSVTATLPEEHDIQSMTIKAEFGSSGMYVELKNAKGEMVDYPYFRSTGVNTVSKNWPKPIKVKTITLLYTTPKVYEVELYAVPDTEPPAAPSNLSGTAGDKKVELQWGKNSESDFDKYRVYQNGIRLIDVKTNYATIGDLVNDTSYTYFITAFDRSGNESLKSNVITLTPTAPDLTPPTVPVLNGTAGDRKVSLWWTASTDNVGVEGYRIYQNDKHVKTLNRNTLSADITELENGKNYTFQVTAFDAAGNESARSNSVNIKPDVTEDVPRNVKAQSGPTITVTWDGVEDATGYRIYRDGKLIATVGDVRTYVDSDVKKGTEYGYQVAAIIGGKEHNKSSPPAKARANNSIEFPGGGEGGDGGDGGGGGIDIDDAIKTGVNFLWEFKFWVILVLGIIFSPTILSIPVWIMQKVRPPKKKKRKGRPKLSEEEKERRAKERKLNKARDDKYDYLTRIGKTKERDAWAKQVNYLTPEQRAAEKERKAREAREARAKGNGAGRKQRQPTQTRSSSQTKRQPTISNREQRQGREGRTMRNGR